jgi:hypothetical protein
MECCLLRPGGGIVPLPDEDGSELYYLEPMVMPEKPPGKPTQFINPRDVMYERFPIPDSGGRGARDAAGFLYAKRQPTPTELAAALECVRKMRGRQ